jgi:galactose-1-phosphate uridylyltransferase
MSINWNYLPPAGSSVIHPHLQALASHVAFTYERETLSASRRYFRKNGSIYWADLIKVEKERSERFIGETGNIAWLSNFAGRGRDPDILVIFQGKHAISELAESDFKNFYDGLHKVFQYMTDRNYASFNLSLYSAPPGEDHFWVHARLKPRFQFPLLGTADYCFLEALHDEFLCQNYPEMQCREIKTYFG